MDIFENIKNKIESNKEIVDFREFGDGCPK